jgi:DNA-binding response OmpR family regulator
MLSTAKTAPHILCVSWESALSETREQILSKRGYAVTSALGPEEALKLCSTRADLLVLGHSVPRQEKQKIIKCFREFNSSPILSILPTGRTPLEGVDYAVQCFDVVELLETIQQILPTERF